MKRVLLVSPDNGKGLSQDVRIIRTVLEALGHRVAVAVAVVSGKDPSGRAVYSAELQEPPPYEFDLGIWLEVFCHVVARVAVRAFVPNPEWFRPEQCESLRSEFNVILTKLPLATEVFRIVHANVVQVGFTSVPLPHSPTRHAGLFCMAGASPLKNASQIVEIWVEHPEWPRLEVVGNVRIASSQSRPNIRLHRPSYLGGTRSIRQLAAGFDYHLCLSKTEGWGHNTFEALGAGKILLYGDWDPYRTELIHCGGIAVGGKPDSRWGMVNGYRVDRRSLSSAVDLVMSIDGSDLETRSQQAILRFSQITQQFQWNMEAFLNSL